MSSEARINASRANGAKSHGPATEEGRQASSQNSRKHGLLSRKVVLEGESQDEFDELLASYVEEHQPETATERTLIENLAVARWRQERVWTLETAAMENQMRRPRYDEGDDFPTQAYVAFHTLTQGSRSLELLNRYEVRFERQFRAALNTLLTLRAKRAATHRVHVPVLPEPLPDRNSIRLVPTPQNSEPETSCDPESLSPAAVSGSFGNNHSEPRIPPARSIIRPVCRIATAIRGSAGVLAVLILLLCVAKIAPSAPTHPWHVPGSPGLLHPCYTIVL
jgi:hypothetical protein